MRYIGTKRLILSIFMSFVFMGFLTSLYTVPTLYDSLYRSRFSNKFGHIKLCNLNGGGKENKLFFQSQTLTLKSDEFKPKEKNCITLIGKISSKASLHRLKIQVQKDAVVDIFLTSPEKRNSDKIKYPVFVDYENVAINRQPIFLQTQTVNFDKPLKLTVNLKKNEQIELEFKMHRHHFTLKEIKEVYQLNPLMLLSVAILAFFFAYKLVQYIASFKLAQNYSRVDITFLAAFIILLMFPISHLSKADKSAQENRMLASSPQLFKDHTFNPRFTQDFEAWINDRFRGRKNFLRLHAYFNTFDLIVKNNKATYHRKTHWAFNQEQFQDKMLSPQKNKEILSALEDLNTFCKKNHIKFYTLITPEKISFYKAYNGQYKKLQGQSYISTLKYLQKKASFPFIYPLEELKTAAQKDFVFFKTEHHWTEWGAYVGYQELIKPIKADFPKLKIATEDDFNIFYNPKVRGDWDRIFKMGQTLDLLNLKVKEEEALDVSYKYYDPKNPIDVEVEAPYKFFHNPQNQTKLKALLTGTSMNENLLQFLPQSFQDLKYIRLNWDAEEKEIFHLLKRHKQDILQFKPDILILSISVGNLPEIVDIAKDE